MEQIKNRYGLAIEPGEFVQIQKEKCHVLSYIERWEDAPAGTSGYRGVGICWLFIDQKDLKKRLIDDGSFAELESEYKQYFDEEPMTQESFDHLIDSTLKPLTLQQFIEGLPNLGDGTYFVRYQDKSEEAAPSAPTAHAPSPSQYLTFPQILSIVSGLANSQGFYGRLLREIQEFEREDPEAYVEWCKKTEALNFTDTLEVILYFEEGKRPKNAMPQHDTVTPDESLVGKRIRIIDMKGEPQYAGKEGYVTCVDDAGQIHGTWGGCALVDGDRYEVIDSDKEGKLPKEGPKTKYWSVPVVYEMYGSISVEAESAEEAYNKVKEHPEEFDLPDEGFYVDDSFKVADDDYENAIGTIKSLSCPD